MRLIDADALTKEAGRLWSEMPDGEELSKELMKAINHAPTVSEWVSVKDRMPTNVTRMTGKTPIRDMMVNGVPEEVSGDEC